MSTGRFAQRGWAFQSFAFRPWGLAGAVESELNADPKAGWIAKQNSSFVARPAGRAVIAKAVCRAFVAVQENCS
jgi:hypothetical protein